MVKKSDNIFHGKPSAGVNPILIASQLPDGAKIRTDIEETKQKLKNLAERWMGINHVRGFLTELWAALGIAVPSSGQPLGGTSSRYAAFRLSNGTLLIITIRASAHNANASNYENGRSVNGNRNLSIVLQKEWRKNTFKPSETVKLDEYIYCDRRIASVENPLSQIAQSLIGYLTNGEYKDTTGAAIERHSPARTANATEPINEPNGAEKVVIKESQLRDIVRETVRRVLSEGEKERQQYGPNGYRIVKGGMDYTVNGDKRHSAISVIDRSGAQSYHVDTDDHCYVFYATWKGKTELYQYPYIFEELLDAIKTLPKPE